MDIGTLISAVSLGAATVGPEVAKIVGTEVVKEMTKDAYKHVKVALGGLFGRTATRIVEKLEADPSSDAARQELAQCVAGIQPQDEPELTELVQSLLTALKDDAAAKTAEQVARIKLDVDSGGHVILEGISGAKEIDVKAKSAGNFEFRNVAMDTGHDRGN